MPTVYRGAHPPRRIALLDEDGEDFTEAVLAIPTSDDDEDISSVAATQGSSCSTTSELRQSPSTGSKNSENVGHQELLRLKRKRISELQKQLKAKELELEQALNDVKQGSSRQTKGNKKKTLAPEFTDAAATPQGKPARQKSDSDRPTTGDAERDKVFITIGKQWALRELFQDIRWFMQPPPDKKYVTDSPERYTSDAALTQCIIYELYQLVPPAFHKSLEESPTCRDLITVGASEFIRNIVYQFRNITAPKIFKTYAVSEYYSYKRDRSQVGEFRSLVAWPDGRRSLFCPVHFPGGVYDLDVVFKRYELALMVRSSIFGPTSIDPAALANVNWIPHDGCNGKSWGMDTVFPGILAMIGILAVFLHNTDIKLEPVGAKSGFPYLEAFTYYKRYFIEGLNKSPEMAKRIHSLIAWYNSIVFPHVQLQQSAKLSGSHYEDELTTAYGAKCSLADSEVLEQGISAAVNQPACFSGSGSVLEHSNWPVPTTSSAR